jgi:hypothetical protein
MGYAKSGWQLSAWDRPQSDGTRVRRVFLVGETNFAKAIKTLEARVGREADAQTYGVNSGRAAAELLAQFRVMPGQCAPIFEHTRYRQSI